MPEEKTRLSRHNIFTLYHGTAIPFGQIEYTVSGDGKHEPKIKPSEIKQRAFLEPNAKFDEHTVSTIGSITKQFTAATLMKLWDNEITKGTPAAEKWFPEGIDTPLEHFMPALKRRFSDKDCDTLFTHIESEIATHPVTLRDLMNHTHALGARNEKAAIEIVRQSRGNPVELADIARTTEKRTGERYGEEMYGNFGCDLQAMIVESIENKPFDDVVKEQVLRKDGKLLLPNTHPQSDNQGLYNTETNIASGYALDGPIFKNSAPEDKLNELPFNTTTNTRAAGGFKSTAVDLARWATLYMGAQLFDNSEVKDTIKTAANAALEGGYHLAMSAKGLPPNKIGHGGDDFIYKSLLAYDPKTGDVDVMLNVGENLTSHITKQAFERLNPGAEEEIGKFCTSIISKAEAHGNPPFASDGWKSLIKDVIAKNPERGHLVEAYEDLYVYISEKYPPQERIDHREKIIQEIPKSFCVQQRDSLSAVATVKPASANVARTLQKSGIQNEGSDLNHQPPSTPASTERQSSSLVHPT